MKELADQIAAQLDDAIKEHGSRYVINSITSAICRRAVLKARGSMRQASVRIKMHRHTFSKFFHM